MVKNIMWIAYVISDETEFHLHQHSPVVNQKDDSNKRNSFLMLVVVEPFRENKLADDWRVVNLEQFLAKSEKLIIIFLLSPSAGLISSIFP